MRFRSGADGESEQRVMREADILARMDHPNIVHYDGSWTELSPVLAPASDPVLGDMPALSNDKIFEEPNMYRQTSASTADVTGGSDTGSDASDDMDNSIVFREPTGIAPKSLVENTSEKQGLSKTRKAPVPISTTPPGSSGGGSRDAASRSRSASARLAASPQDSRMLYIMTELCSQGTLQAWIANRNAAAHDRSGGGAPRDAPSDEQSASRRLVREALEIFGQIAAALAHLHEHGFAHRDVKPGNIFFGADGAVRLGDFGSAREVDDMTPATQNLKHFSAGHTHTVAVGTPTYASPEQLAGAACGVQTDLYALGVVLAELVCPVGTQMERAALLEGLRRGCGLLKSSCAAALPEVAKLVEAMTNSDPAARPSALDVLEACSRLARELE